VSGILFVVKPEALNVANLGWRWLKMGKAKSEEDYGKETVKLCP
jgi:hypothetical protein